MRRLWLIGLREFRAYAATWSFWVALAVGPVLMLAGAGVMAAGATQSSAPLAIALSAPDPVLRRQASEALADIQPLAGRPIAVGETGQSLVRLTQTPTGLDVHFGGQDLPPGAREVFAAGLQRRQAEAALLSAGLRPPASVRLEAPAAAGPAADPERAARFGLVFILWLTLTGSLGMLLQAVVRERANRALDSLMAAAQPVEIVFGKLLGVGAVSALVLSAWLGTAAALSGLVPTADGAVSGVLATLAHPLLLVQATGVYVLTYVIYGSVTVALGAAAQDSASAQNLARPMFGVLLIAFFAALISSAGASASLSWMIWLPPLTPFMLLLSPAGALTWVESLGALGLTAITALVAGWVAAGCLTAPGARSARIPLGARAG